MEPTNIIELNGKRYDAVSGRYVGPSHNPAHNPARRGKTMDGVMRMPARGYMHLAPASSSAASKPRQTKARAPAKHAIRHQPEHTKTLMRHAVAKPAHAGKKQKAHLDITQAPKHTIALKQSVANVHPARKQRAHHTPRSRQVQRFNHLAPERSVLTTRDSSTQTRRSVVKTHAAPPIIQQVVTPSTDIFEAALAQARSHEQQAPRAVRRRNKRVRALQMSLVALAIMIMGGFAAWTQKAHIEVAVASWQTGFRAQVPDYAPLGYNRGSVWHEHGQVHITYHSGDSNYRVTQQASDWNSQTLRDQGIAGVGTNDFTAIESKGRIIYIHGHNASWVDGGARYDITGNAPLTTDDIARIAEGL